MTIDGYADVQVLHSGARTTIFRARRVSDDRSVVLKQLRAAFPSAAEIARLQREFDLTRAASGPGVIEMYGMHTRNGTAWIEMEDGRGGSLDDARGKKVFSIDEVLAMGVTLVNELERLHRAGIVHKDVNPSNVLLSEDGSLKLIDFGLASTMTLQVPARGDRLEGTPSYMSPEQTGRMNRALDWRSDYYSLGASLYHLLTGAPPFSGDDPIETAYAHIARRPVPPCEVSSTIPRVVSDVVMKLLEKRADDRYQSARGLRHDLERCRKELRETGAIRPFALRSEDRPETLRIPDTLYGRAAQVEALEASLGRVARGGSEAVFVAGAAGTGKTSLVGEIHRGAALHRAVMVSGKFEQFQREVPYASILRALRQFLHQLLGLAPSKVELWRARLSEALGDTGGVLSESLPELELLVGALRKPPEVSSLEAENRFLSTLVRLVGALPAGGGPAVLFLDDLQWADPASIVLLEKLLLDPNLRRVLVLGTYRSNEVDEAHPLLRALGRASDLGARISTLSLGPLSTDDVGSLLAETLGRSKLEVSELSQLAHAWTAGNPFLLHRLVESLVSHALLRQEASGWEWDVAEIARRGLGEDAAGFVAGRLSELPPSTRRALEVASCIGATFDSRVLAQTLGKPIGEVRASLAPALSLRLLHPIQDGWWPGAADEVELDFAFSHDRIQEVAHARLTAEEERDIHLQVGRQLLRTPEADVFDVVHHLNLAVAQLSPEERASLLRLDAEAGRRALRSGAFVPALQLLEQAVSLLPGDAWTSDRDATFALTLDTARAGYLAGASEKMDAHIEVALSRSSTPLDRVAALEIRALDRAGRDVLEAVDVALQAMGELGVHLPRRPEMSDVGAAMGAAMGALSRLGPDGVMALPELDDPVTAAVVQLANTIMAPAYLAVPLLLPVLAAELVSQTLARGVTPSATYGYAVLSLVLTATGAYEPGHQLAKLCLRLMERFHDRGADARPGHVVMGHVLPFTLPIRETVPLHRAYLPRAMAAGDHEYAGWIAHLSLANAFYAGTPLDMLWADLEREMLAMKRLGQRVPYDCTEPFWKEVSVLRGHSFSPARMDDGRDEESHVAQLVASGSRGAVYVLQTQRLLLRFFLRDLRGALAIAEAGAPYADGASVTYHIIVFHQTVALVCAALSAEAKSPEEKQAFLARAREHRAQLEAPAAHAPHNHLHRLRLIDAEIARATGDTLSAIDGYDEAIAAARTNHFIHEEALSNELAGRFYLERGRLTPARAYLLEAGSAYARWGANAKLRQLEEEFPDIVARSSGPASSRSVTMDVTDAELDLATLSKTTLAITSEIRTERLVERVLTVSIQNAGATRGLLLLERDGTLKLGASQGEGFPPRGTPIAQLTGVPLSILQYVARTGARLVVPDARFDPRFSADPAISRARPLSVLALPLILMGKASGLIYLENDLTADAFPQSRTQLLEMLGAQAAISLENARLYGEAEALTQRLQARVRDRSRELAAALERLSGSGSGTHQSLLTPGTVLAEQVRIVGMLGAGGMGVVYVGEDLRTHERVAVKVVLGSVLRDDSAAMQRFLRESHAAASVSHPAVARTLAVDVSGDGLIFQVQELIDGEPLKRVLERYGTLSSGEAARLGATLASGLAEAHKVRIVHRDIKPSNVMLTSNEPGLKLLDFGIARLAGTQDEPELTTPGQLVGTPDYMAPEQFLAPDRVDVGMDVYAVGLVLYRALSGRLPDHRIDRVRRVIHDPAPIDQVAPHTTPELATVVMSCLARNPVDRPSAAELCEELTAVADAQRVAPLTALTGRWIGFVREQMAEPPPSHEAMAVTLTTMSRSPDAPDAPEKAS